MPSDRYDSDSDRDSSYRRSRDRRSDDRGRYNRRSEDRPRYPRRYDDDRFRSRDRPRRNDDRYDDDRRSHTRRCNHCDRCPVHGTRTVREYPSDKFKVVFDGIPDCQVSDIEALCRDNGLESVYAKITRNGKHAIVEFKNLEDRDAALQKLNQQQVLGSTITVREFRSSGTNHDGFSRDSRHNSENHTNVGDSWRRDQDEDIYADIDSPKPENGEFDV